MIGQVFAILSQVGTLVARLSATRAGNLDFLDAPISGLSVIRSIQYGTIGMATSTTTATASVAAVTTGKSMLIKLGTQHNSVASGEPGAYDVRLALTNTTTVTAERSEPGGITNTGFCLVEFK